MTAISSSLHGGQVSQYYVHCVYRVGADRLVQLKGFRHAAASQHLVEHVPADQRHELNGNFEGPIFPSLSWESDIQVHLWAKTKGVQTDWCSEHRRRSLTSASTRFIFSLHRRKRSVCLLCVCVFSAAHPRRCHRQWVGCVQTLLSIVDWPAIPKDCHLEVLHHRVNHLPAQEEQKRFAVVLSLVKKCMPTEVTVTLHCVLWALHWTEAAVGSYKPG